MTDFEPARKGETWNGGWRRVVYDVCLDHRVKIADLMVGDKRPAVVEARREIIQRLRYDRHYSLKQICDCLSLHHTSVIYNLRRAEGVPARELKRWAYRYAGAAA